MSKKVRKNTASKIIGRARRHARLRKKVQGEAARPRLCVTRGSRIIFAQLIDDVKGATMLAASTSKGKTANVAMATALGKELASLAQAKGIKKVVFDRGGYIYHGKIAALAQGAREGGLEF